MRSHQSGRNTRLRGAPVSPPLPRRQVGGDWVTPAPQEKTMYLVREVMYCKPGNVRPMVEKFVAMSKLGERVGMPRMRVLTDFCAE
jgi:hypothetical protein